MQNINSPKALTKKFLARTNLLALLLVIILTGLLLVACGDSGSRSLTTAPAGTSSASVGNTQEATNTSVSTTAATTAATSSGNSSNAATTAAVATVPAQTTQSANPSTASAAPGSTDQAESNSVVSVVKNVSPAVVTVYNKSKYTPRARPGQVAPTPAPGDQGSGGFVVQGVGSGVIVSKDGYIVTNNHVVDGEDDLAVALNDGKTTVTAKLVGRDKLGDIAVLKITAAVPAVAKWAERTDVGETVVAIGSALGNFRNSVSRGVVSGLNRTLPGDSASNVYIQTDASINPGNSGGPLLNLRGEIVGINTAVLRSTGASSRTSTDIAEGLGFAIPAPIAKILSDQIISKGAVTRPYFGITYQMITPAEAGTLSFRGTTIPVVEGAWINRTGGGQTAVVKGGPADKAGLKDNDVITAINGEPLNDNNPLGNVILKYKPNDTVKLTVQRGDQALTVDLTLAERPADA